MLLVWGPSLEMDILFTCFTPMLYSFIKKIHLFPCFFCYLYANDLLPTLYQSLNHSLWVLLTQVYYCLLNTSLLLTYFTGSSKSIYSVWHTLCPSLQMDLFICDLFLFYWKHQPTCTCIKSWVSFDSPSCQPFLPHIKWVKKSCKFYLQYIPLLLFSPIFLVCCIINTC